MEHGCVNGDSARYGAGSRQAAVAADGVVWEIPRAPLSADPALAVSFRHAAIVAATGLAAALAAYNVCKKGGNAAASASGSAFPPNVMIVRTEDGWAARVREIRAAFVTWTGVPITYQGAGTPLAQQKLGYIEAVYPQGFLFAWATLPHPDTGEPGVNRTFVAWVDLWIRERPVRLHGAVPWRGGWIDISQWISAWVGQAPWPRPVAEPAVVLAAAAGAD